MAASRHYAARLLRGPRHDRAVRLPAVPLATLDTGPTGCSHGAEPSLPVMPGGRCVCTDRSAPPNPPTVAVPVSGGRPELPWPEPLVVPAAPLVVPAAHPERAQVAVRKPTDKSGRTSATKARKRQRGLSDKAKLVRLTAPTYAPILGADAHDGGSRFRQRQTLGRSELLMLAVDLVARLGIRR